MTTRRSFVLLATLAALVAPATAQANLDMSQITPGQYADGSSIGFTVDASGDVYGYSDAWGYTGDVCETADFAWYAIQTGGTLFTATCTPADQVPYFTDYWSAIVPAHGEATSFSGTIQIFGELLNANLVSDGAMTAAAVAGPGLSRALAARAPAPTAAVRISCVPWSGRQLDALGRCHGNVQLRTAAGRVVAERYVHIDANRTRTVRLATSGARGRLRWHIDHYAPGTGALHSVEVPAAHR